MPGSESAVLKREEMTKRKRAMETIGMARLTLSDKYGKLERRLGKRLRAAESSKNLLKD
jgi:nitrogen regulatory protein PII